LSDHVVVLWNSKFTLDMQRNEPYLMYEVAQQISYKAWLMVVQLPEQCMYKLPEQYMRLNLV